jgi:hypothetical protein
MLEAGAEGALGEVVGTALADGEGVDDVAQPTRTATGTTARARIQGIGRPPGSGRVAMLEPTNRRRGTFNSAR